MRTFASRLSIAVAVACFLACSSSSTGSGFGTDGNGNPNSNGGGGTGDGSGTSADGGTTPGQLGPVVDGGQPVTGGCVKDPASYDIPGNNCDDDNDGKVDNVVTCDTGLSAGGDAMAFAKAIGLCQVADATHWGVVSATFTNGHSQTTAGSGNFAQQHGILSKFGTVVKPREGAMLGVLSSGSATEEDSDTGPKFKGGKGGMQGPAPLGGAKGNGGDVPAGFPKAKQGCGVSLPGQKTVVNDVIDVKLSIKVPNNAKGLGFDFDFWSGEWPDYVCSNFNDAFIAYLKSAAFKSGAADNISFDTNGDTISVNNNFFGVCTPNVQTGCSGLQQATSTCTLGASELGGTGFDYPDTYCTDTSSSGGATSWLTSQAPVQPGETISLEFLIWDTGDESYDSSVLIDNFVWVPSPITGPVTNPSPPK